MKTASTAELIEVNDKSAAKTDNISLQIEKDAIPDFGIESSNTSRDGDDSGDIIEVEGDPWDIIDQEDPQKNWTGLFYFPLVCK